MVKKKEGVPGYATNPVLGVMKLEWFIVALDDVLNRMDKRANLFIIKNKEYKKNRKVHGKFGALLRSKQFVGFVREGLDDGYLIGEFDNSKFLVMSSTNSLNDIMEGLDSNNAEYAIGATAETGDNDTAFDMIERADKSVNLALRLNKKIQID